MSHDVLAYETPRGQLADALIGYMRGEVDNFGLDDASNDAAIGDPSLRPIVLALWFAYDDVKRHTVRANRPCWQAMRRCVAFLLSAEGAPPRYDRRVDRQDLWPFRSWASLRRAAPAMATVALPQFDSTVHGRPIRRWDVNVGPSWVWLAAAGLCLVAVLLGYLILAGGVR